MRFLQVISLILLLPGVVVANPNGATVRHGSVDIARSGNLLQVHQHTQNAVIDWQSFSIQSGETTQFLQPGSSAAILNRVTGVSQSQIDGLLKANGRVLLVNPNGIVIGRGGRIDVGGFVASSLDVSNAEFLAGGDMTFRGGPNSGAVVNLGSVRAGDGDVFLFAPRVENAGSLSAPHGTIGLGAGSTVLLKATGSERIFIEGEGTVVNSGTVAANLAELKAHGGNVYAMAIKNSGRVVATGVRKQGGQVFLTGRGGKVKNSGTISATRSNGSGGAVKVEAKEVELESATVITVEGSTGVGGVIDLFADSLVINDDALVDASGATGGGAIFAGGGFRGEDSSKQNAITTTVGSGAVLRANSLVSGDAGQVIVWADEATNFAGAIEASALGATGHGGFAEVSGKIDLEFSGSVELIGAGNDFHNGTLLLDPQNFTIGAAEATSIIAALNGGMNVVVSTSGAGADAGDIFVNSAITTNAGASGALDLVAHRHIRVNNDIQINGTGRLQLVAGLDFSTATFAPVGGGGTALVSFTDFGINNGAGNGSVFINDGSAAGLGKVSVGSRSGETGVYGYDVTLSGDNSASGAHAMIGFFALRQGSGFDIPGDIVVQAKNDVILTPGSDFNSPAQIGHIGSSVIAGGVPGPVGAGADANASGSISISAGNDVILTVSSAGFQDSYSQIGHGNSDRAGSAIGAGNLSGAIAVSAGRDISLTGRADVPGAGGQPHVQIGHGGVGFDGTKGGMISLMSGRNLSISGGTSGFAGDLGSFSLVGHGGPGAAGTVSGDILAQGVGDIALTGGREDAFARIGHGGTGTKIGAITVTSTGGNLALQSGSERGSEAQIGHGVSSASHTGFIQVIAHGDITSTGGQIGHATGTQRFGNTFIGVGQSAPNTAGSGMLTADAASVFLSEPKDTNGELRFYAPTRSDVDIALGANLNGIALASNNPYPNEQGFFLFGNGPYNGDFGFYFDFPQAAAPVPPPSAPVPPSALPEVIDPTGILLPDFENPDPIGNEPFTVENEFYGDEDGGGVFRNGDPREILSTGERTQQQGTAGAFSADDSQGGFPEGFEIPDGLVEAPYGIVSFQGDEVVVSAAPPEIAATLGEHLSDNARTNSIPGGVVEPEMGVVSFGEGGVRISDEGIGRILAGRELGLGAGIELESSILGIKQSVPLPGGVANREAGVVAFGGPGVDATMPPSEVAQALAEALGENARDGNDQVVRFRRMRPEDGTAEFRPEGSSLPQTVTEEINTALGDALGTNGISELEAAFGE